MAEEHIFYEDYPFWKRWSMFAVIKVTSDLMCVVGWTIGFTIIAWDQIRGVRKKHPITFAPGWEGHEGDGRAW